MARMEDIQVRENIVCNVHLFHVFLFLVTPSDRSDALRGFFVRTNF